MTADGQDPDDGEGQPDQEEERVLIRLPELFVLYEPFLRRLRVTDKVASAIEELHSLKPKSWNSDEQARIRLACVRILEEYAEALEGESGELPMETAALYQRTRDSLAFLRDTLEGERRALADFSQDLEESGYELDPGAPGGFKVRTGKRGKPRGGIPEAVKQLLLEWHPDDWDDDGNFTGEESGQLRCYEDRLP